MTILKINDLKINTHQLATMFAALIALSTSASTFAVQYVVTKTTDSFDGTCDSDCSLREAVYAATSAGGNAIINLGAGTYELTRPALRDEENEIIEDYIDPIGDIDITGTNITIRGADNGTTIIDAKYGGRHFSVFTDATLTLKHITLINGATAHYGAAILNSGTVQLENSALKYNRAISGWHRGGGGAITNYGTLHIQRTEFINNVASFGDTSYSFGGAIQNTGTLYIRDSSFRNNRAHTDDVIGYGGAIYNTGNADIGRSVFTGNTAQGGGMAIHNEGNITISNATISGNYGDYYLSIGALHNEGTLSMVNTSIVNNWVGAGLYNTGSGTIRNSIILNNLVDYPNEEYPPEPLNCHNMAANNALKIRGLLTGGGNTRCAGEINIADSETFTSVLAPLAQNNYHLETHALLPNSPAIDAGVGSCSSHDQRWLPRPVDGNADGIAGCDLGAFELQPTP